MVFLMDGLRPVVVLLNLSELQSDFFAKKLPKNLATLALQDHQFRSNRDKMANDLPN